MISRLFAWLRDPIHLTAAALCVICAGFVIQLMTLNGVNTPYMDEWENSALIAVRTAEGTLGIDQIVRQNFDHRLVLTNLTTIALTLLTNWNLQAAMLVNFAVVALTFLALVGVIASYDRRAVPLALIPFALLTFTLRQRSLWLWGGQLIGLTLVVLFFALALLWVRRAPIRWTSALGAAALCVGMSLSVLQGFFGWPLIGLALLLRGYRSIGHFALFLGLGALTLVLYLNGYDFSLLGANEQGNGAGLVSDPLRVILYTLAYLGNPFVPMLGAYNWTATAIGAGGLILAALNGSALWRSDRWRALDAWLPLIGFAIGSGALTALGRALLYPERIPVQPLLDRYTPPPSLLWIAVVGMGALAIRRILTARAHGEPITRGQRLIVSANIAALAVGLIFYVWMIRFTPTNNPWIEPAETACVLEYPRTRNVMCMTNIYLFHTPPPTLSAQISGLMINQLALFSDRTPIYTEIHPLYEFTRRDLRADGGNSSYGMRILTEDFAAISLRQSASTVTEFDLTIPDADGRIVLASALFIDPEEIGANGLPTDGVVFSAEVEQANGIVSPLFRQALTPLPTPIALELDLTLLRGQTVRLRLIVDAGDHPPLGPAFIWVDPRLEVRPEAAS